MNNQIRFLDLHCLHSPIKEALLNSVSESIEASEFILGSKLKKFESEFSDYTKSRYCVGVSNGLDALVLILKALGISKGDEVIVPAATFIATWNAVSLCGAIPVPVDCDAVTYNINPDLIEARITERTRAIIAVHLYGLPANLEELSKIAKSHSLHLIEDAAQAHGATYKNLPIGSPKYSDAIAFSFYPGKNLGALGDGGAITTDSIQMYERLKYYRNYGSLVKYKSDLIGHNARLDDLQAGFLSIKLKYLDCWVAHRNNIAKCYRNELKNLSDILLPPELHGVTQSRHLYVIQTKDRYALQEWLSKHGIETGIHYPIPPYLQTAYKHLKYDSFKQSNKLHQRCISLPIGPHITLQDCSRICKEIKNYISSINRSRVSLL